MTDAPHHTRAEAARICDVSLATIRKRADRGSLATCKRDDGTRLVSHDELERTGPPAGLEVHRLRRENPSLSAELAAHRRWSETAQAVAHAERQAHERATSAYA